MIASIGKVNITFEICTSACSPNSLAEFLLRQLDLEEMVIISDMLSDDSSLTVTDYAEAMKEFANLTGNKNRVIVSTEGAPLGYKDEEGMNEQTAFAIKRYYEGIGFMDITDSIDQAGTVQFIYLNGAGRDAIDRLEAVRAGAFCTCLAGENGDELAYICAKQFYDVPNAVDVLMHAVELLREEDKLGGLNKMSSF